MKSLNPLMLLVLLLQLTACAAPSYYAQAISGHFKLMREREKIETILAAGDVEPELARELQLARQMRDFGISELGLEAGDSYTQFVETGQQAVTWNVIAAPEFSLQPRTWCFPASGCVAYRGYFKQQAADKYAEKLAQKTFDVTVSPAIAYSTLGWFDDPLLDTMLQYNDEQLAAFLFHELAHQQLYVKGDTAFNEAYASFIEQTGVSLWLKSNDREDQLELWQARQQASRDFTQLLLETRLQLANVYSSNADDADKRARKTILFKDLEDNYQSMVKDDWDGHSYYSGWFSRSLNNARLALIDSYQGGVCAFTTLYHSVDGDMAHFQQLSAEKARLNNELRREWLNQPCGVIASEGNL